MEKRNWVGEFYIVWTNIRETLILWKSLLLKRIDCTCEVSHVALVGAPGRDYQNGSHAVRLIRSQLIRLLPRWVQLDKNVDATSVLAFARNSGRRCSVAKRCENWSVQRESVRVVSINVVRRTVKKPREERSRVTEPIVFRFLRVIVRWWTSLTYTYLVFFFRWV